jgi:hypothetical protein
VATGGGAGAVTLITFPAVGFGPQRFGGHGALASRQRKLTGQVRQRFQCRAHALVHLGAGFGGHPSALLDQRQGGFGLKPAAAQALDDLIQLRRQLVQGVAHNGKD